MTRHCGRLCRRWITRLRTRDVTLIEAVCMGEVRRVGGVSAFVLRQIAYLLPHRRRLQTRLAVSERDCVCVCIVKEVFVCFCIRPPRIVFLCRLNLRAETRCTYHENYQNPKAQARDAGRSGSAECPDCRGA